MSWASDLEAAARRYSALEGTGDHAGIAAAERELLKAALDPPPAEPEPTREEAVLAEVSQVFLRAAAEPLPPGDLQPVIDAMLREADERDRLAEVNGKGGNYMDDPWAMWHDGAAEAVRREVTRLEAFRRGVAPFPGDGVTRYACETPGCTRVVIPGDDGEQLGDGSVACDDHAGDAR